MVSHLKHPGHKVQLEVLPDEAGEREGDHEEHCITHTTVVRGEQFACLPLMLLFGRRAGWRRLTRRGGRGREWEGEGRSYGTEYADPAAKGGIDERSLHGGRGIQPIRRHVGSSPLSKRSEISRMKGITHRIITASVHRVKGGRRRVFVGWWKSWDFFPTQNLVCRFPFPRFFPSSCHLPLSPSLPTPLPCPSLLPPSLLSILSIRLHLLFLLT